MPCPTQPRSARSGLGVTNSTWKAMRALALGIAILAPRLLVSQVPQPTKPRAPKDSTSAPAERPAITRTPIHSPTGATTGATTDTTNSAHAAPVCLLANTPLTLAPGGHTRGATTANISSNDTAATPSPLLTVCQTPNHGLAVAMVSRSRDPAVAHVLLELGDTLWSVAVRTLPPSAALRSRLGPSSMLTSGLSAQDLVNIAIDTSGPKRNPATSRFSVAVRPVGKDSATAVEVDAPAGTTLLAVAWVSAGRVWSGVLARNGSAASAVPVTPHWSAMGTLSLATPDAASGGTSTRGSAGLIITRSSRDLDLTLAAAPPPLLPPLGPLLADANRRYPRETPDSRPELVAWRQSALPVLWVDTRRVDRTLGFVRADLPLYDVHTVATMGADGRPTFAAVGVGDGDTQPVAVRFAALRSPALSGAAPLARPSPADMLWTGVLGLSGGWGQSPNAPVPVDSLARTHAATRPYLRWEWDATGQMNDPRNRSEAAHVAGGIPLAAIARVPLLGTVLAPATLSATHDRLAPGFGTAGASWAPSDGLTATQLSLTRPLGHDTLSMAASIRTPELRFDLFRPVPLGVGRETIAGVALTHPVRGASWDFEAALHSSRLDTMDFGTSPMFAVGVHTTSGWSGNAHAEGTPLYQALAPGREAGATISRLWSTPRMSLAAIVTASAAWQCGPTRQGPPGFSSGDTLAVAPPWTGGCIGNATSSGAGVVFSTSGQSPLTLEMRVLHDTHAHAGSVTQLVPRILWATPVRALGTLVASADCPGYISGPSCQATLTFARTLRP